MEQFIGEDGGRDAANGSADSLPYLLNFPPGGYLPYIPAWTTCPFQEQVTPPTGKVVLFQRPELGGGGVLRPLAKAPNQYNYGRTCG